MCSSDLGHYRSEGPRNTRGSAPGQTRLVGSDRSRRHTASLLFDPAIALVFEFEGEFLAAGFHDPAIGYDVDIVGHDVVEQALVVGDDEQGAVGGAQGIDPRSEERRVGKEGRSRWSPSP